MKKECKDLQARLSSEGAQVLREDVKAQEHLVACDNCFAFAEALSKVERSVAELPVFDASDALVQRVLNEVHSAVLHTAKEEDSPSVISRIAHTLQKLTGAAQVFLDSIIYSRKRFAYSLGGLSVAALAMILVIRNKSELDQGSFYDYASVESQTTSSMKAKVVDLDGWILGEDGQVGMAGTLIDPIGKAIAGAGMAGFVPGIGAAMSAELIGNKQLSVPELPFTQKFFTGTLE